MREVIVHASWGTETADPALSKTLPPQRRQTGDIHAPEPKQHEAFIMFSKAPD
jgi:hypothetical protein